MGPRRQRWWHLHMPRSAKKCIGVNWPTWAGQNIPRNIPNLDDALQSEFLWHHIDKQFGKRTWMNSILHYIMSNKSTQKKHFPDIVSLQQTDVLPLLQVPKTIRAMTCTCINWNPINWNPIGFCTAHKKSIEMLPRILQLSMRTSSM